MSLSTLRTRSAFKFNFVKSQVAVREFSATGSFSTNKMSDNKLRIAYIPEHFSTPLHYAYEQFGLKNHATLIEYPAGTGTMIEAFHAQEIDVAIGLTEGFITGLTKIDRGKKPYHMVGQFTLSPLLWAISTGGLRGDLTGVDELRGLRAGISRYGSGSHIMASVLAQERGWFSKTHVGQVAVAFEVCGAFANLRHAVGSGQADYVMWEHFTSKKYYDTGELKKLGEIYTPWNAWHITAAGGKADERVAKVLLPALEKGVQLFKEKKDEAVKYISANMPYSPEDADAWYETVKFAERKELGSIDAAEVEKTVKILKTAGVLGEREVSSWKDLVAEDFEKYV